VFYRFTVSNLVDHSDQVDSIVYVWSRTFCREFCDCHENLFGRRSFIDLLRLYLHVDGLIAILGNKLFLQLSFKIIEHDSVVSNGPLLCF